MVRFRILAIHTEHQAEDIAAPAAYRLYFEFWNHRVSGSCSH